MLCNYNAEKSNLVTYFVIIWIIDTFDPISQAVSICSYCQNLLNGSSSISSSFTSAICIISVILSCTKNHKEISLTSLVVFKIHDTIVFSYSSNLLSDIVIVFYLKKNHTQYHTFLNENIKTHQELLFAHNKHSKCKFLFPQFIFRRLSKNGIK